MELEKKEKVIKIVCISDTHNKHNEINLPEGDILLHAGDFTYQGSKEEIKEFNNWLGKQKFKHKVVIAGNHEFGLDLNKVNSLISRCNKENDIEEYNRLLEKKKYIEYNISQLTNCTYIQHETVVIEGIKIFGTSYQPVFFDWAFNIQDKEREIFYREIPDDTDILITHCPPYNVLDLLHDNVSHVGCPFLKKELKRIKPKLHLFGHIHESNGRVDQDGTTFINAAICNLRYKPKNPYYIYEYKVNQ